LSPDRNFHKGLLACGQQYGNAAGIVFGPRACDHVCACSS